MSSTKNGKTKTIDKSPVIEMAQGKERSTKYTTSTGVMVILKPISPSLVTEAQARIKDPLPPVVYIKDIDREEPNENDPAYLATLQENNIKRGQVAMDAMIMFGVELVDEIPNDNWEQKLKFMGFEFNETDKFEREFYYKKYIAISTKEIIKIGQLTGVTEEAVNEAAGSFPGN